MRDAVRVRVLERAQHFHGDPPDVRDAEPGFPPQRLARIVAGHIRHHVPEEIVRLSAVDHAGDVRVVELRGVADFTQEAVGGDRNDQLGMQHFDGHVGAARIPTREDARVATPADRCDHGVAIAQGLADPLDQVASRHGVPSPSPDAARTGCGCANNTGPAGAR